MKKLQETSRLRALMYGIKSKGTENIPGSQERALLTFFKPKVQLFAVVRRKITASI